MWCLNRDGSLFPQRKTWGNSRYRPIPDYVPPTCSHIGGSSPLGVVGSNYDVSSLVGNSPVTSDVVVPLSTRTVTLPQTYATVVLDDQDSLNDEIPPTLQQNVPYLRLGSEISIEVKVSTLLST